METVLDQVRRAVEQCGLFTVGETIIVGVSGGPDSLCLLHLLCRLRSEYRLALHVAHLNHGLRGADADADAEFIRRLAADWDLSCCIERADVPSLARSGRLAVEEAARRARYAFLADVAVGQAARTIAVGHNADDQAETVLMHWLRGSGLAGLRGMLPKTPLSDYRLLDDTNVPSSFDNPASRSQNLHLVRPLLELPRFEIEAYCARHGLDPRIDQSNLDTTYFRNWLRHEVLPLLARHNPNVRQVLCHSAQVVAEDYALLRSLVEEAWPRVVIEAPDLTGGAKPVGCAVVFDLAAWRALPVSLQRSMLREAVHRLRRSLRNINFVHIETAVRVARDGRAGDRATLPGDLMLTVGYDRLTMADTGAVESLPDWPLLAPQAEPVPLLLAGDTHLPDSDWRLHCELLDRADLPHDWAKNPDPWRAFLDARCAKDGLFVRTRHTGDRFRPLGMGGHEVKLSDFFTNHKVSRAVRDRLPLLVSSDGIVWVCGLRADERARVGEGTERVLVAEWCRVNRWPTDSGTVHPSVG